MSRQMQNRAAQGLRERIRWAMSKWDSPCCKASVCEGAMNWEQCLPPDPRVVPEARRAAIQVCKDAGASEEDCFALDLALGEALANAVTHGTPSRPQSNPNAIICLRVWRFREQLIVEVHDQGPGFEPPLPPYPMPDDYEATHGRGLPLMQRMTDALLVSRGDARTGGATVYLIKALHSGQGTS